MASQPSRRRVAPGEPPSVPDHELLHRRPELDLPEPPAPGDGWSGAGPVGPEGTSGASENHLATLARRLAADPRTTAHLRLPARVGVTAPWPAWLPAEIRQAYVRRGIAEPWRHQVRTAELAHAGEHVVISTGTASGKSAAYGMPALTAALSAPPGTGRGPTVLYLAPTKALAHDQLDGLAGLGLPGLRAGALDGDCSDDERAWARAHARWLVTNPDMLHRSVLPAHERWRTFLRSLQYVIVDEAHVYRGVFGANVALVLRRLRRVAALHGARPTFIAASATAADPAGSAAALLGMPVAVVEVDDSARGPIDLVLWRSLSDGGAASAGRPDSRAPAARTWADSTRGSGLRLGHGEAPVGTPTDAPADGIPSLRSGPDIPQAPGEAPPSRPPDAADPSIGRSVTRVGAEADLPPAHTPAGARHREREARMPAAMPGEAGPGVLELTADVTTHLIGEGASTLAFARSRRAVEVIAGRIREDREVAGLVRAYRGGYLPEERRALESALRAGRLRGLVTTNALELGINISGLDAVVLAGWPGRYSSFWQQIGRAGRRAGAALALLIAREDPLDVYIAEHPEVILDRTLEHTALDPSNPYVLAGHLCSAAAEAPLRWGDGSLESWFGAHAVELCAALAEGGLLRRRSEAFYWTRADRAVDLVDLRGTGSGPIRVVEEDTGRLLGTVDPDGAPAAVHPGALYVHQNAVYEVLDLDLDQRVATASATLTDLSTHALTRAEARFLSTAESIAWAEVTLHRGQVEISRQVHGYLVRRWPSGMVLARHALELPASTLQTAAVWWEIPVAVTEAAGIDSNRLPGALHALEHSSIGVLPLLASCDRGDLGGLSTTQHPQTGGAVIVVHDGHPGGSGFTERGAARAVDWLRVTRTVIAGCPCQDGCPACVQSPKCGNANEPLDKGAALILADALLARAPAAAPDARPLPAIAGPP